MNPWIAHVKAYASEQKISYGQALKDAKATYKAKSPEAKASQTEEANLKSSQTEEPKPESVPKPKAARKPTTTVTRKPRKKAIPSLPEPKDVDIPCM